MTKPTNLEEFQRRFAMNQRIEGFGLKVETHIPCGFCGAAELMVVKIADFDHTEMQKDHVCLECGRGVITVLHREDGGLSFEIFQTCGDDPPGWMPKPWPKRR